MNTTASYSADSSWSRRGSTETVFSIQDKDTDIARDTSDTEWLGSDGELEPVSESDGDPPVVDDTSSQSDDDIIATKVIEVSALDEGDLELADSERTASESDSETDLFDFWQCAQCRAPNDKPLYRYCQKCYKVRKNFFPPRPKRKKRSSTIERKQRLSKDTDSSSSDENDEVTVKPDSQERSGAITVSVAESVVSIMRSLSQDSGVGSSQDARSSCSEGFSQHTDTESVSPSRVRDRSLKRRADSADREEKRAKTDYADTDSEVDKPKKAMSEDLNICDPKPLVKTVSDPSLNVESTHNLTKKALINALKEKLEPKEDNCIICYSEPKSGVFVHGRVAHICCCYKCAVKVWAKAKRCPVCNCKVSNVLKAVVM